ncbi:hypothetical protein GCM10027424_20580 [Psychrobacter pacificensis]|uniref:Uncharacterized protein n=1 Tax=Psychrobacter pacificensis TaxID=112002 RepID=A0ABQ5YW74_9GAMM|nr:hypothetical protein GCM10007915_11630 [Psychrobacter pacificensis]
MTPTAKSGANKIGVWLANIAIPTIITRTIAVLIRCHILIEPYNNEEGTVKKMHYNS